jgi:hypothetical protein
MTATRKERMIMETYFGFFHDEMMYNAASEDRVSDYDFEDVDQVLVDHEWDILATQAEAE